MALGEWYRGVQAQIPICVYHDLARAAQIQAIITGTLAFAPVVANALAKHVEAIDEGE